MGLESFASIAVFCSEFIATPRSVGSLIPSSGRLARRIAKQVPASENGLIVELGAGTGAITEALLSRLENPQRLVCVECSPVLAERLRKRFPEIVVIEGDAMHLDKLLRERLGTDVHVGHIVSSLPLRSLSPICVRKISQQVRRLLPTNGHYIQFTYHMADPGNDAPSGFRRLGYSRVWGNLPPARVDVFIPKRAGTQPYASAA